MASAGPKTTNSFVFIQEPGDEEQRRSRKAIDGKKVRQQAMRYAVTQKSNTKTTPATYKFLQYTGGVKTQSGNNSWQGGARPPVQPISPNLTRNGYEWARTEYKFDILRLSALTTLYMGRGTATFLYKSPTRLKAWMQVDEPATYLEALPALYQSSKLLRSVVNATMARAHRMLCGSPVISEATVLGLYGVALHGLQNALNDPAQALEAEVLCATQVFQLFEVSTVNFVPMREIHANEGMLILGYSFLTFPIFVDGHSIPLE
jgi:hypothetical protein